MANRSAAAIFSVAFEACAAELSPTGALVNDAVKSIAKKLWEAQNGYDFTEDQMGCDDALVTLGFAKMVAIGDPLEGETVEYLKSDGEFR